MDITEDGSQLRMVNCQRVEQLQRLQTCTSLLQVCSEVRQELLPYFYTSLQFHIDGVVATGLFASRLRHDAQPHIHSLSMSPTFFDTDYERLMTLRCATPLLLGLESLTIKGSKSEGLLMEYRGRGIYGYPKIAGRRVYEKDVSPETMDLGHGRRLSREMVETLKCIHGTCKQMRTAFYDGTGPLEIFNNSIRPIDRYPDVLLLAHESAGDGWVAFDIDRVVFSDRHGRYIWEEDQVRKRLTPFEGETYGETEETSEEQLEELNVTIVTTRQRYRQPQSRGQ